MIEKLIAAVLAVFGGLLIVLFALTVRLHWQLDQFNLQIEHLAGQSGRIREYADQLEAVDVEQWRHADTTKEP